MPFPIGKTTRRATLAGLALGIAAGLAPQAVMAQGWPSARPITMLNPFPSGGGGTDAFARPLAAVLDKQLNQRVIIDNRGGAGGTLAQARPRRWRRMATPSSWRGAPHHCPGDLPEAGI